jgi:thiol:disulfide interchange protein DsbD
MHWQGLPKGVRVGPIQWPLPHKIKVGPLANYGYDRETLLLFHVTLPVSFTAKQLELKGKFSWLVCKEECIPGAKQLSLTLPVASKSELSLHRALFDKYSRQLPLTHASLKASGVIEKKHLTLSFEGLTPKELSSVKLQFFPSRNQIIKHAPAPILSRADGTLTLRFQKNDYFPSSLSSITGLLQTGKGVSLRVDIPLKAATPTAALVKAAPPRRPGVKQSARTVKLPEEVARLKGFSGFLQTILLSIFVGLLLNLMPCVFPVLTVKVLHFLEIAEHDAGKVRRHGLSYTLGVMLSFSVLAIALIALRAGGSFVGWGFQLQSPLFILLLTLLMFAMGLSMSGLFEFGTSLTRLGGLGANQSGYFRSFSTGVLATIVATPCLAPWMWVAIAYALAQPAIVGILVFNALGFGMAIPYLLFAFFPSLLRFLPRPGAWMETFKQLMAFPLYATALWLLWVLGKQAGVDGMLAGLSALLGVSFGLWLYTRLQSRFAEKARWFPAALALVFLGASFGYGQQAVRKAATALAQARKNNRASSRHLSYSKANFQKLARKKQHIFLNFTAAWCVSCKVNEKLVLQRSKVQAAFQKHGVQVMIGDWTNTDPEISAILKRFGRDGVPLYLLYDGRKKTFKPLPQILTPALVIGALKGLSQQG